MRVFVIIIIAIATVQVAVAEETAVTIMVTPLSGYILKDGNVILKSSFVLMGNKVWRKVAVSGEEDLLSLSLKSRNRDTQVRLYTVIVQFNTVQIAGKVNLPGNSLVQLVNVDFTDPVKKEVSATPAPSLSKAVSTTWASIKSH